MVVVSGREGMTYRLRDLEFPDAQPTDAGFAEMNWLTKESERLGGCDAYSALHRKERDYLVAV